MSVRTIIADVFDGLRQIPDDSVHMCLTSPPYWKLRDYSFDGQIGLEPTVESHVDCMVKVFREVRRTLRRDGVLFLNYGDMWATSPNGRSAEAAKALGNDDRTFRNKPGSTIVSGLKPKDLVMMPERVALALQTDGWWVRDRIIWHKPNPMPSSVKDRCTPCYEIVWQLSKSAHYFWDGIAIAEDAIYGEPNAPDKIKSPMGQGFTRRATQSAAEAVPPGTAQHKGLAAAAARHTRKNENIVGIDEASASPRAGFNDRWDAQSSPSTRNRRNVWTIATEPYKEAHFATMPTELARLCILAGSSEKGCCMSCGAPWTRVTEKIFHRQHDVSPEKAIRSAAGQKPADMTSDWAGTERGVAAVRTIGWTASCACQGAVVVPCTVLDPFGGAGTTGLVADRLQRHAILIEANADYAENHINKRVGADRGPLLDFMERTPL